MLLILMYNIFNRQRGCGNALCADAEELSGDGSGYQGERNGNLFRKQKKQI